MSADARDALRAGADEAARAGKPAREAALHRELATVAMADGAVGEARAALERAHALSGQLGDVDGRARDAYALALLHWQSGTRGALPRRYIEEAEACARKGGDLRFLARVLDRRAGMLVAEQRPAQAALLLNDVAALHGTAGDADAKLEALRRVCMLLQMQGRSGEAFDVLLDALADSKASPAQVIRARLELHLLSRGVGLGGEPLQRILDEAVFDGDFGAAGYIRMQMAADAIQAGDLPGGEALAGAARADALECTDPILYLNACLLLAEVRDRRGDRVGVLTILFTCQASMRDLLGEKAARPVLAVLHSLETRWGQASFDAALEAYRAQFRAADEGSGA